MEDVTIIVSSCDKYEDMWAPFFKLLFKYWPSLKTHNKDIPIILITNEGVFSSDRRQVFRTGKNASCSSNMLRVLKSVKTKYILYFQEDYLMSALVNEKRLQYLLEKMKQENIANIILNGDSYFDKQPSFPKVKETVEKDNVIGFKASLQSGFWDTKIFESLSEAGVPGVLKAVER